jgi:two-component system response regulator HydG
MNAMERAVVLAGTDYLSADDFALIRGGEPPCLPAASAGGTSLLSLEEIEKTSILNTLEATGGNKSETARRLGITRRTLHKKLKAYGVMK